MISAIAPNFWLNENCVRHPRISGGVAVMLRHMNTWLRKQRQEQCDLDEFVALLKGERLPVVEVAGVLLVSGLGLKEDVNFIHWYGKRR
jgi:hypothetical protein